MDILGEMSLVDMLHIYCLVCEEALVVVLSLLENAPQTFIISKIVAIAAIIAPIIRYFRRIIIIFVLEVI